MFVVSCTRILCSNSIKNTFIRKMATKLISTPATQNITFITTNDVTQSTKNKPLVIILSWLMAKKKHVNKFAEFYTDRGFDVMNINLKPWQLLVPVKGTQVVASEILQFLLTKGADRALLIHGFSIGGYLWGETLLQMETQNQYKHIPNQIVGQVWDSAADITEIPEGFPSAVFPTNKVLQSTLRYYTEFHLKTFENIATRHYVKARNSFYNSIVRAPALFFLSKVDPVGSERSNLLLKQHWEETGISVKWKCWDDSPHVSHFYHHPKEYLTELKQFLDELNIKGDQRAKEFVEIKSKL